MNARWKRNAVVATMMVLVGSAVLLNWKYSGQEAAEVVNAVQGKFHRCVGQAHVLCGAFAVTEFLCPVWGEFPIVA